jgi:hypothetical protein
MWSRITIIEPGTIPGRQPPAELVRSSRPTPASAHTRVMKFTWNMFQPSYECTRPLKHMILVGAPPITTSPTTSLPSCPATLVPGIFGIELYFRLCATTRQVDGRAAT